MLMKILLFVVLYVVWVLVTMAVVFGALTVGLAPGVVPFPAIAVWLVVIMIPAWWFNRYLTHAPGWTNGVLATGTQATATVLSVKNSGVSFNYGRRVVVKIQLRVEPDGEAPFEASLEKITSWLSGPSEGDTIQVKYDPRNKKHVVILSQSDLGYSTGPGAFRSGLSHTVGYSRGSAAGQAGVGPASQNHRAVSGVVIADQLANLAQLHRSGDLSDAEFEAAKKKLLG